MRTRYPEEPRTGARWRAGRLNAPNRLWGSNGVAFGPDGRLYVAEADAGRVVAIDAGDRLTVLAEGLDRPVDVAFDEAGRCYVSDEGRGALLRIEDGSPAVVLAEGLGAPQGLTVLGGELFAVETAHRRLLAVSLGTGECRTEAEELPVGPPPGAVPGPDAALFAGGLPDLPARFAGLAATPDGSLLLSADGEGTVLRLSPRT